MPGPKSTHKQTKEGMLPKTGTEDTPRGFLSPPPKKRDLWDEFGLILAGLAISVLKLRRKADCAPSNSNPNN